MNKPNRETDPRSQRHEPTQKRGKERVDRILRATRSLVADHGVANIKMTEVASVAGIPIGSLYQYFPTRSVLLSKLFEDLLAPIDAAFLEGLNQLEDWADMRAFVDRMPTETHALVKTDRCLQQLLNSTGVDPSIRAADFQNTLLNATRMSEALQRVSPVPIRDEDAFSSAVLICHFWGAMVALLQDIDDEELRHNLIDQYSNMIHNHLDGLAGCAPSS